MLVINFLLYFAVLIAESLACRPLSKIWKPWQDGTCFDKKALDVTTGYFNLGIDLVMLWLPQNVIWRLQMTRSRKIGVSVIFSFGILYVLCR